MNPRALGKPAYFLTMSFTYSSDNLPVAYVRLLIADTVAPGFFSDEEIGFAYQINAPFAIVPTAGGQAIIGASIQASPRRVAATLLGSLAADRGRLSGSIKVLDVQVSLKDAAAALRAQAKDLIEQDDQDAFAIIEWCPDAFAERARFANQMLRLAA